MTCRTPRAPISDTASVAKFDSTLATATSIASGSPVSRAAASKAERRFVGIGQRIERATACTGGVTTIRLCFDAVALPTQPATEPERAATKSRR